jgi:DNA-binding NtrC family response regulator
MDGANDIGDALWRSDGHLRTLAEIRNWYLHFVLRELRGDITKAARQLRVGRATLYRLVEEANIDYRALRKKRGEAKERPTTTFGDIRDDARK